VQLNGAQTLQRAAALPLVRMADESNDRSIPRNRVVRSARVGILAGLGGARYAGAKAANLVRSKDRGDERMEELALESAEKLVETLGTMKGAAMKMGQLASFIDTDYLPDEYREIYQEKLGKLRTSAPAMPWEKVRKVLTEEYDEPYEELFGEFETQAFAAASIGQVHRATLPDGRKVAVKIQYPGVDAAIRADLSNAGMILRFAKALAPGLDAKAVAKELKERVLEELDYEYEAQNQRTFARAYRDHPFIYVPDVVTRLSRDRVLVTEYVEGLGFDEVKQLDRETRSRFGEIVFRFYLGSIFQLQHFNADAHPGNYLLRDDGRVAFLDFGMTKRLDREQIELEIEVVKARVDGDPERLREKLHDLGFLKNPQRIDAERLMRHVDAIGGWYWEDAEKEITSEYVMGVITAVSDPRSDFYSLMRRENVPANELMGRRMEIGVLAVLGQLRARRNWHRIGREWWFDEPPSTDLGHEEHAFWEERFR
jgi:predicted unusual protein kinase regulating ubiquinone biosynthesis (AarF/ABC1/UbiB family)